MSDTVYLGADAPPKACDYCLHVDHVKVPRKAEYDARTLTGQWANLCAIHFKTETLGRLGTGYGQRLVYADDPADLVLPAPDAMPGTVGAMLNDKATRKHRAAKARTLADLIAAGDFDAAEDLIGDGDLMEWL